MKLPNTHQPLECFQAEGQLQKTTKQHKELQLSKADTK